MNYSLVINSQFKPFSYAELMAPVNNMQQAHEKLETAYAELAAKAGQWDMLANEATDPIAHAQYKKYADDLRAQAELLARQGLNPQSRADMYNMLGRFASEIVPIEQAYNRRNEQIQERRKALLQDPTRMFEQDPASMSLDTFLQNPNLDTVSTNYSGEMLRAQVASAAANLAKELRDNPRKWQSILGGTYYETLMRTGKTSGEIMAALSNNPAAQKELKAIVDQAISSSGMSSWSNWDQIRDRAYQYANQGLWSAIGTSTYKELQDPLAVAREQARIAGGGGGGYQGKATPSIFDDILLGTNNDDAKHIRDKAFKTLGIGVTSDGRSITTQDINVVTEHPDQVHGNPYVRATSAGSVSAGAPSSNSPRLIQLKGIKLFTQGRINGGNSPARMFTKEEFVKQGKTQIEKKALEDYYDHNVREALQSIDTDFAPKGQGLLLTHVYNKGKKFVDNNGAATISGLHLNTTNPKDDLPKTPIGANIDSKGGAYEITASSYRKKNYTANDRARTADIIKNLDKEGNLSFRLTLAKGFEGLIIQSGDKQYFVPKDFFPSTGQRAFDAFEGVRQREKIREDKIKQVGIEAWYNDANAQAWDRAIETDAEAIKKTLLESLFHTYSGLSSQVLDQNLNSN